MILSPAAAHLACLGLVGADLAARTVRLRALAAGLRHPVTGRESLAVNLLADAGSALTPLRLGGEPARLLGLLRAGVPAIAAFSLMGIEVLITWPLTLLAGLGLAAGFAPAWLELALPGFTRELGRLALPLAIVTALSVIAALVGWRWLQAAGHRPRRSIRRFRVYWRRMPRGAMLAAVPLTLVNVATRTALLPVLALATPDAPPAGVVLVGSFALVYGQLFLPTPAGVGAVELGFLAGAAGEFGAREAALLGWWRFYSVGLTALLGSAVGLRWFGWGPLRRVYRVLTGRAREAA
jgi:uncharacterized membrane protein YbhN (UPF0104 family)